jgi:HK97 family phage portal protein
MGLRAFTKNVRSLFKDDFADAEQRGSNVFSLLTKSLSDWFGATHGVDTPITAVSAMRITTAYICVLVRAESLSTLRASVHQSTDQGSKIAYGHPAHRLIHDKPNPFQTAADYWKSVSAHIDLNGNSFSTIKYSGRYQANRIDLIPDPSAVEIVETESGKAYYRYDGREYADYEILHFKDLSLDGFYGCSKIHFNADTLGYARNLRKFGTNSIKNRVDGYFSTSAPFDLIKAQEKNLQAGWAEAAAHGKIPYLPLGLTFKPFGISPNDAQYLDSINATKEDIYGMFRIPPTLAQNYERATFANAEQQDLVFVKHTMLPLITNIEQECNAKLFAEANSTSSSPYYVKFNVNAFMRGDFATRTQGYKTLWERGLITGNMVADLEDWDHFDGGERRFIPMNMIPLDKIDEFINGLSKPVATNVGDEGGADNQERSISIEKLIAMNGFDHGEHRSTGQGIIYNDKK